MPPSRRRPHPSAGQAPPVRRPRVAGLRNRPATARDTEREPAPAEPVDGPTDGPTDGLTDEPADKPADGPRDGPADEPADGPRDGPADEPAEATDATEDERHAAVDDAEAVGAADAADIRPDVDDTPGDDEPAADAKPTTRAGRPAGKRRATGTTRPADLRAAEAGTRADGRSLPACEARRRRAGRRLSLAIVLVVVAIGLSALAVWFRGEAANLESADTNTALTDPVATSEALGQLRTAVEETFSFNYTDLESTERAVDRVLTGRAKCDYDLLYSHIKELAPKQKLVLATLVHDIALVRLDGDHAEALVYIDQSSTRADKKKNNSVDGEGHFTIQASREDGNWKITDINLLGQSFVDGKPAPTC